MCFWDCNNVSNRDWIWPWITISRLYVILQCYPIVAAHMSENVFTSRSFALLSCQRYAFREAQRHITGFEQLWSSTLKSNCIYTCERRHRVTLFCLKTIRNHIVLKFGPNHCVSAIAISFELLVSKLPPTGDQTSF